MNVLFRMSSRPAVLAHQGGWDELLLIAGPIIAIAGLLLLAKRRLDQAAENTAPVAPDDVLAEQNATRSARDGS